MRKVLGVIFADGNEMPLSLGEQIASLREAVKIIKAWPDIEPCSPCLFFLGLPNSSQYDANACLVDLIFMAKNLNQWR